LKLEEVWLFGLLLAGGAEATWVVVTEGWLVALGELMALLVPFARRITELPGVEGDMTLVGRAIVGFATGDVGLTFAEFIGADWLAG